MTLFLWLLLCAFIGYCADRKRMEHVGVGTGRVGSESIDRGNCPCVDAG